MKRLITLLTGIMILGITACGIQSSDTQKEPKPQNEKLLEELSYLLRIGDYGSWWSVHHRIMRRLSLRIHPGKGRVCMWVQIWSWQDTWQRSWR